MPLCPGSPPTLVTPGPAVACLTSPATFPSDGVTNLSRVTFSAFSGTIKAITVRLTR